MELAASRAAPSLHAVMHHFLCGYVFRIAKAEKSSPDAKQSGQNAAHRKPGTFQRRNNGNRNGGFNTSSDKGKGKGKGKGKKRSHSFGSRYEQAKNHRWVSLLVMSRFALVLAALACS